MDLNTGKFTAPRPGTYFFSFEGTANFGSSSGAWFHSDLYLNGNRIGLSYAGDSYGPFAQSSPMSIQSTLYLKKGDQVWVVIYYSNGSFFYLFDDSNHWTHFTGFLLEEEIVESL
jgi:hypothetical protein